MKRYLVLGYDGYYPLGGWSDFKAAYALLDVAKGAAPWGHGRAISAKREPMKPVYVLKLGTSGKVFKTNNMVTTKPEQIIPVLAQFRATLRRQ